MNHMRRIRTLLVIMPFHNIWSPNIGTSILQAVLRQQGYDCDIYYANIDFAKETELDFAEITHGSYLLTNDILFANLLNGSSQAIIKDDSPVFDIIQSKTEEFIDRTARKISKINYDLVGFSLIFQSIPALVLARRIKELAPNVKIVMGGSNCEGEMGLALHQNFKWIDYVCAGEGEGFVLQLVKTLSKGNDSITEIPNLIYRENGESKISVALNKILHDLDSIPKLDYSNWKEQLEENGFDINSDRCILPLETSRGCWYGDTMQCVFCGLSGKNLMFRTKAYQLALEEIEHYQNSYGVHNFFTTDLIFPNEYFKSLLPELKRNKTDRLSIIYEIKATIGKKQLVQFKEAGINTIQPGLETLNSNILKIMRKSTKAFQNIRVLKWSFEAGLTIVWNILYGLPNENVKDYDEMVKLVPSLTHLQPPLFGIFPIVLQRFSPLYNEIIAKGNVELKPLDDYYKMYDLPENELRKLAYYFVNPENENKDFDYIDPLKVELWNWYESIGKSVFFSLKIEDKLYFYDSRPIAGTENWKIEGFEKEIYEACDEGINLTSICKRFELGEKKVERILEKLTKRGMLLYIDNKYLSLAVSMDEYIHENLDAETNLTICASIYRTLMKKKCNTLRKIGERNLRSVVEEVAS